MRYLFGILCLVTTLMCPTFGFGQSTAIPIASGSTPIVQNVQPQQTRTAFITYRQCLENGWQAFPVGDPVYDDGSYKYYRMRCIQPQEIRCIPYSIRDKLTGYPSENDVAVCDPYVDECCGIGGDGVLPPTCLTTPTFVMNQPVYPAPIPTQVASCCGCGGCAPLNSCRTIMHPQVQCQNLPAATIVGGSVNSGVYCPAAFFRTDGAYDYYFAMRCRPIGLCVIQPTLKLLRYPAGTPVIRGCYPSMGQCHCNTQNGVLIN